MKIWLVRVISITMLLSHSSYIASLHFAGLYGVPVGLVCSLPVTFFPKGYWNVQEDVELDGESKDKLQEVIKVRYSLCFFTFLTLEALRYRI